MISYFHHNLAYALEMVCILCYLLLLVSNQSVTCVSHHCIALLCTIDHLKSSNCYTNPWCVYGLGEMKEGIWGGDNLKIMQSLQRNFISSETNSRTRASLQFMIDNFGLESRMRRTMPSGNSVNIGCDKSSDQALELAAVAAPIGLKNLGATCYLNVLIQCLYHNPCVRRAIYCIPGLDSINPNPVGSHTLDSHTVQMRRIVSSLQSVFAHMEEFVARSFDLKEFVGLLGLNTSAQQDPQEFNRLFIEQLEKLQKAPDTQSSASDSASVSASTSTPTQPIEPTIASLISGIECYAITCRTCGALSKRESIFHELDLNISDGGGGADADDTGTDLGNIIKRNYCYIEELAGDNKYECTVCCARLGNPGARQDATRVCSISRFPAVLFLQMMRYVYDAETGTKKKLATEVDYPSVLELAPGPGMALEQYCLTAVLYHTGKSAYSGHYITEVLDWVSGMWWLCDDAVVTEVSAPVDTIQRQRRIKEADRRRRARSRAGKKSKKGAAEVVVLEEEGGDEEDTLVVDLEAEGAGSEAVSAAAAAALAANVNRLTDVYMLCYVKKSTVDSYSSTASRPAAAPTIPPSVAAAVQESNGGLMRTARRYCSAYEAFKVQLAARKELYLEACRTQLAGGVVVGGCRLVPSAWLRSWVTGVDCYSLAASTVNLVDSSSPMRGASGSSSSSSGDVVDLGSDSEAEVSLEAAEDVESGVGEDVPMEPLLFGRPYTGCGSAPGLLCTHGLGLDPRMLSSQFKVVSAYAFEAICSSLVARPSVEWVVPAEGEGGSAVELMGGEGEDMFVVGLQQRSPRHVQKCIRCDECAAAMQSEQSGNVAQLHRLKALIERLQEEEEGACPTHATSNNAIVDRSLTASHGRCARKYFWVSRSFLSGLKKYYKDFAATMHMTSTGTGVGATNTPQKAAGGISQFCTPTSAPRGPATGNCWSQSKVAVSMQQFSEIKDVNAGITCVHGLLVVNYRSKSKLLSESSWRALTTHHEGWGHSTPHECPYHLLVSAASALSNSVASKAGGKRDAAVVIENSDYLEQEQPRCCLTCQAVQEQEEEALVETEFFQEQQLSTTGDNCLRELYDRPNTSKYNGSSHISPHYSRVPPSLLSILDPAATPGASASREALSQYHLVDFNWLTRWRSFLSDADRTVAKRTKVLHDKPPPLTNAAIAPLLYCGCRPGADGGSKVVVPSWICNLSEFYNQLYGAKPDPDVDYDADSAIYSVDNVGGNALTVEDGGNGVVVESKEGATADFSVVPGGGAEGYSGGPLYPEVEIVTSEQWRRLCVLYPVGKGESGGGKSGTRTATTRPDNGTICLDQSDEECDIKVLGVGDNEATPTVCDVAFSLPPNLPEAGRWSWRPAVCARCTQERVVRGEWQRVHFDSALFKVVTLASHSAMSGQSDSEHVRSICRTTAIAAVAAAETSAAPSSSSDTPASARGEGNMVFVPLVASSSGRQRRAPAAFVPGSNSQGTARRSQRTTKKDVLVRLTCTDTVVAAKMKVYESLGNNEVVNPMRQLLLFSPDGTEWTGGQKTLAECAVAVDEDATTGASTVYVRVITRSNIEHYMPPPRGAASSGPVPSRRGRKRKVALDDSDFEDDDDGEDASGAASTNEITADRPRSHPKEVLDEFFTDFISNYEEFSSGGDAGGLEVGFSGTFLSGQPRLVECMDVDVDLEEAGAGATVHVLDHSDGVVVLDEESNLSTSFDECQEDGTAATVNDTSIDVDANEIDVPVPVVAAPAKAVNASKSGSRPKRGRITPTHSEKLLQQLKVMGFAEDIAIIALEASNNNIDSALRQLIGKE